MKAYTLIAATAAMTIAAGAANAADVLYTDLPVVNVSNVLQTATTTTDSTGRTTTANGFSRTSAPNATETWRQTEVGGNAIVGITTNYSNDGDGAAYFAVNGTNAAKADLTYNFKSAVALSSLQSISFEWYVDPSSTSSAVYSPVLRLLVARNGVSAGFLVLEPAYNGGFGSEGVWTLSSSTLTDAKWWATNNNLGQNIYNRTLQNWIDAMGSNRLTVTGVNFGVGSGWTQGTTYAAVDNVSFNFANGPTETFNFRVLDPAAAVPEPASWAMMISGFALLGGALRSRTRKTRFA
jgi:hypothetical protein